MSREVVRYGTDPAQRGSLHRPDCASQGLVVVIHGGFWKAEYDAALGEPLAERLAESGWTAWNLEYRRVGNGGGFPTTLDDVAAGIDALAGLDLGADLGAGVVTLGHSAGGHLAVWAAARGRFERWSPVAVPVTAVISQAGVVDLAGAFAADLGSGAVGRFMGGGPDASSYASADPTRQLPLDVPVWCVHARDDEDVPFAQSEAYVAKARAAGATAELVEVPGGHFGVVELGSPAWARIEQILATIRTP
ncbi:MAG: alpha/beta hydrolase [Nocardioides sp.]|uniref:alpha/beta hydrolase n=1 Tax=Nocardioides sp. TaxID=35761 RepID=UPI0039E6D0AA